MTPSFLPNGHCLGFHCEEEEANKIIEEKLLDIARILGISMECRIEDMGTFIGEMLEQEQGKRQATGGK